MCGLLAATGVLYLWGLSRSGWANEYYAAAVQAGSSDATAMLFGSLDGANLITVDKPPAALWVMELSARIFGLNSWSLLVPQALEGVATVGMLYATVRRWFGATAGLIAGGVVMATPVATVMFRFDNPDALLTLLLVAAAWATVRAVEGGSGRWLTLAGGLVGVAFLTKMLQAYLVLPGLVAAYLVAAPTSVRRRVIHLLAACAALLVASFSWIAVVQLWPARRRPYIGGSTINSVLELVFGYNGFGRLTGQTPGAAGSGGAGPWGPTGWNRLVDSQFGGQIGWFLPAALLSALALLWCGRRRPRTDRTRAVVVIWGGWLLVAGAAISFGQGVIHPYYTVALAPPIAALTGIGVSQLARRPRPEPARVASLRSAGLALIATSTVWTSVLLLRRTPDWLPWLWPTVAVGGTGVAVALVGLDQVTTRLRSGLVGAGLLFALAGPAAVSVQTAALPHGGLLPLAGPGGDLHLGRPAPGQLGGRPPGEAVTRLLQSDADRHTWAAATINASAAAQLQLAGGHPVMALGGFTGTDPWPTLARFQELVSEGAVHYFLVDSRIPHVPILTSATAIREWVESRFPAQLVDGIPVYDLVPPSPGDPPRGRP